MLAFSPEQYAVHTEVYDGPLELLLYLIRRDGIDVRDIPISQVTNEYLRYLDMMAELDLDVAGDFLVMAATLCMLKSRELLPRAIEEEDEEEELDPREELARRLLEYQRYKEAAEALSQRRMLGRDIFARPLVELDPADRPVDPTVDAFGLLEAFYRAVRASAQEEPTHQIELEEYSMAERLVWILDRVHEGVDNLREMMLQIHGRSQRILSFLAILEMAKLQFMDLSQDEHLGDIKLVAKVRSEDVDMDKLPDIVEGGL
ncbi:MAG: segregation/condensation protein A [Myxococcota bacterium]|nr:segregation/condensation protein A [Myxococcota bacterium]